MRKEVFQVVPFKLVKMNGAKAAGKGARSSKRNRDLLSCTECHRRKQKCNRLLPCNDCTQRGVPQKCEYKAPV